MRYWPQVGVILHSRPTPGEDVPAEVNLMPIVTLDSPCTDFLPHLLYLLVCRNRSWDWIIFLKLTNCVLFIAEQNSFIDPAHNVPQSRSTDQCQEDCEPTEPQAFVFDDSQVSANVSYENDLNLSTSILSFTGSLYGHQISSSTPTETGRGSQDSGFFDQSRRRPATDELSFGLALFVKRPREFEWFFVYD